jgi:hypothetical protein
MKTLLATATLLFSAAVLAQNAPAPEEGPKLGPTGEIPAAPAAAPKPAAASPTEKPAAKNDLRDEGGTTIIGERESPIGLYITPWREAYSQQDLTRPARLLQVDLSPVDREVFRRQVEYYKALEDAREAKLSPAPAAAPARP